MAINLNYILNIRYNKNLISCVCAIVIFFLYQKGLSTYSGVPNNDPTNPLGWWAYFDQSQYKNQVEDFLYGKFEASKHFYPPAYAAIVALISKVSGISPENSFLFTDLSLFMGYGYIFIQLMSKYIGPLSSAASLIVGIVFYEIIEIQWIIPWTSTLSAFLIVCCLKLFDRYYDNHTNKEWSVFNALLNACMLGMSVALLLPTRPGDFLAVGLPISFSYLLTFSSSLRIPENPIKKINAISAMAGISTGIIVLIIYFVFNRVVFGSIFGEYIHHVNNNGMYFSDLGEKFYSQLLDAYPYYGPQGDDWLSVIPLFLLSLIILIPTLFIGPIIFRLISVSVFLALAVAYAYSDIVPTGTFRYFNIHYFKWFFPVCIAISVFWGKKVFHLKSQKSIATSIALIIILIFIFLVGSIKLVETRKSIVIVRKSKEEIAISLPDVPIDYIDLINSKGAWEDLYFGHAIRRIVVDDNVELLFPRDFRLIPETIGGPGVGVRLIFTLPVKSKNIKIFYNDLIKFPENEEFVAQSVSLAFKFGSLLSNREQHKLDQLTYKDGSELIFSSNGNAQQYLTGNWSGAEAWGRWIDGKDAGVLLRLSNQFPSDYLMRINITGYHPDEKTFTEAKIEVNACNIAKLIIYPESIHEQEFIIPKFCLEKNGLNKINFENINPQTPKSTGGNVADDRFLGLGLKSMSIKPLMR